MMEKAPNRWDSHICELTPEQGREKLNSMTEERFGMPWEEFIEAHDRGEAIDGEHTAIMEVVTLRSLAG